MMAAIINCPMALRNPPETPRRCAARNNTVRETLSAWHRHDVQARWPRCHRMCCSTNTPHAQRKKSECSTTTSHAPPQTLLQPLHGLHVHLFVQSLAQQVRQAPRALDTIDEHETCLFHLLGYQRCCCHLCQAVHL
jgi:hypothetical protein